MKRDPVEPAHPKARSSIIGWNADDARRGRMAFDYRASMAMVWRRRDRGETPETCVECGTETDVETPAHDVRCKA